MKNGILRGLLLAAFLILAVVLGKLGGDAALPVSWLSWLGASAAFGFGPATLDVSVLQLTFGIQMSLNILQCILFVVVIVLYWRLCRR